MKQLCLPLLGQRFFRALFLPILFCAILWASCRVDYDVDRSLDFPKTFNFTELLDRYTKLHRRNEDGKLVELTREQAGSFGIFLDSTAAYTDLGETQLDFTGMEFLDNSRVRLFSDGSLGIPQLDTTVGYTKKDENSTSAITVDWTLLGQPLVLTLGNIDGQYLSLTPVWFYHTYRPFGPFEQKYAPLRTIYSTHGVMQDLLIFLDTDFEYGVDFGRGDTLAVHWSSIHFK